MIFTKQLKEGQFVLTKNEIGYQEVLDDFKYADSIVILTFNISDKKSNLLNYLKDTKPESKVTIFSNIPQRYENYFSEEARKQGNKRTKIYIDRLDPEKFDSLADTNFCFSNHSKIILTENIAYIGSANFSDESKNNIESGVITRDKEFIQFFIDEVVPVLKNISEPYFANELTKFRIILSLMYSKLANSKEELHMGTHQIADHQGQESEYYSISQYYFNLNLLENLKATLWEIDETFNALVEELQNQGLYTHDIESLFVDIDIENLIELFDEDTVIYDMANFDEEKVQIDYLNENSLEAYDEHLSEYQERASQLSFESFQLLESEAKEEILELQDQLKDLSEGIEKMMAKLPKSPVNPII